MTGGGRAADGQGATASALRRGGLPMPGSRLVASELGDDAVRKLAAGERFPAVLKPLHGTDSRTTVRVDDAEGMLSALRSLFHGVRPDMVLEEYLPDADPCLGEGFANYLSVESVVSAGSVDHFAVTGASHWHRLSGRRDSSFLPT